MDGPGLDTVAAAWREDGVWSAAALPVHAADSMETLVHALRQFPGEGGVIGLIACNDEFFMIVRVRGDQVGAVVSDAMSVVDWPIVEEAMDWADVPWSEAELAEFEPLGDRSLCADLGLHAEELRLLCADEDTYPDEQLRSVVDRLGLARAFAQVADS
jgi:putative tRNA adenosine deaminase-associated protein